MTQNQIAFQNVQETKRSNLVKEGLEGLKVEETKRSNLENERVRFLSYEEQARTNLAQDLQRAANLEEQKHQYRDMAPYRKAESVAKTAKDTTQAALNVAKTVTSWIPFT